MASDVILKVAKRPGGKAKTLRTQGLIPGIIYGQGKEATAVQIDQGQLLRAYQDAGTSKIINVEIDGEGTKNVLFHDVQYDHLGKNILHFDLYTVKMDEEIQTEVPLIFSGDAPAVYEKNATLITNLEAVEVRALPKDLPENIEVDITGLTDPEQTILVGELPIPSGVALITDAEELVVKIEAAREEEEEEELPEDEAAMVESEHGGDTPQESDEEGTGGEQEDASKRDSGGQPPEAAA